MKIVFHGDNAATFSPGFAELLSKPHEILVLSDALDNSDEREHYASADVIIGNSHTSERPDLSAKLFQAPAAGYDRIDLSQLPTDCALCNCFGHENAIAEYVFAALLARHVPLNKADKQLRQGNWQYRAGNADDLRTELGMQSIGIVGYGHIGKTLAERALAFGMAVHIVNRSDVINEKLAGIYGLDGLSDMFGQVDIVINTLPLTDSTNGIVNAKALAAMQAHAIIMNVGRGPVIDEDALYNALVENKIAGAILDTWYVYPAEDNPTPFPGKRPFHQLSNVTMTPHMSAWTTGTIARRRAAMAENANRLEEGRELINRVQ